MITVMLEVIMPLNIKNAEVEQLVDDVTRVTGESKTEAVRRALDERKSRLALKLLVTEPAERFQRFLEDEVWPLVPLGEKGRTLSRTEEDEILGYGAEGV
jgi:antitoxin VapB